MFILLTETKHKQLHLPTIVAIAIVAWCSFAVLHEIAGHAGAAILLGEQVRGAVTTTVHIVDFYNLDHVTERIGWWGFRAVAAAGTLVNFITAAISLLLLHSRKVTQPSLRYFLWLFATISIFQQAFWLAVMPVAALGGDWTAFFIELTPEIPWKLGVTILGFILLWMGYKLPLRWWAPSFGAGPERSHTIWQLSFIPFVTASVVQMLSILFSPLAGSRHTTLVSIFSLIPLMIWLILFNQTKYSPAKPSPETIRLQRSDGWIVAGFIVALFFIAILGPGIGSFEGHPHYLK